MKRQHFAALAVSSALALSGCATAPYSPPLSESAVRLDLPLVRQDALHECGLASIAALCQYWGVVIPADERAALARTAAENEGLSGAELQAALDRVGMESYLFRGALDRSPTGLYRQIDAGRPPLVMLAASEGAHHYGLVLGYDEERGRIIVLDPLKGEILVPVERFERDWSRCERFTLLACPRADPETNPTLARN